MFSRINDWLGRSLLVLLLIKPTIDLGWWITLPLGIRVPPLFAGLLCLFLLPLRLQAARTSPPFLRLFEVFIGLHLIALVIGIDTNERLTALGVIEWSLRILNSYLIYYLVFAAATRNYYRDVTPFIQAIFIGSTIPLLANLVAVPLGLDFGVHQRGATAESLAFRETGLYYDAGTLANMVFFHAVFTVFLLHLSPSRRKILFVLPMLLLLMADLYLISLTKSRAVTIELTMFMFVYLLMFQRRWGKILAPAAAAVTLGAAVLLFDIDIGDMLVRFESETTALEGETDFEVSGDRVSFGSLRGLGSNRGMLWEMALSDLLRRSVTELLFGNFSQTVSHSDYLDIMSRSGFISLVIYLIAMVGLTLRALRLSRTARNSRDRTLYFMAFTLLICYLAYAIPFRPLAYTTSAWYMWLVVGLAMARAYLAPMEAAAARHRAEQEQHAGEPPEQPEPGPADEDPEASEFPLRPRPTRRT